jgi:hypothetical protein
MDLTKHMRFQSVRLVGAVGIEISPPLAKSLNQFTRELRFGATRNRSFAGFGCHDSRYVLIMTDSASGIGTGALLALLLTVWI